MKNRFIAGITAVLAVAQLASARPSQAAIGGLTTLLLPPVGIPILALGGLSFGLGGAVYIARSAQDKSDPYPMLVGVPLMLLGLVLLEDNGRTEVRFSEMSPEQGAALGLSAAETQSYNSELEEINAIRESVEAELFLRFKSAGEVSSQDAATIWDRYSDTISPEALAAVRKISAGITAAMSDSTAR